MKIEKYDKKLLWLLRDQGYAPIKYREIGRKIGCPYPQTIKATIARLIDSGKIMQINKMIVLKDQWLKRLEGDLLLMPFYTLDGINKQLKTKKVL